MNEAENKQLLVALNVLREAFRKLNDGLNELAKLLELSSKSKN